ncbi:MAG: phospholipase D-like domain-containing protein [Lachnospira sp.]
MNKKELLSIPNILGYFRILLVPIYLIIYYNTQPGHGYTAAAVVLGISAITDMLDGKIARRFNMVTEFGKFLDPVADKLTQFAVAVSLTSRFPLMRYLIMVIIIRDVFLGVAGFIFLKKGKKMNGAQMHGKVATALFFILMVVLLLDSGITYFKAGLFTLVCIVAMLFSMLCYMYTYYRMAMNKEVRKTNKKVVPLAILLVLIMVVCIVVCALVAYKDQPALSEEEQSFLSSCDIWKEQTVKERTAIIEDNEDALTERLRMINNAKQEIIMSTFGFHDDDSGKLIIGAMLDAANRGVSVKILVDGVDSWTSMEWNPYFYALSSNKNVEIKVYNKANPLTPWKSMGRMHDKYLIADKEVYLLGGRNTFNFFLGDYPGHKNYDRDVLVYCENPDSNSSVTELLNYFDSVWNYKESKYFHNNEKIGKWSCVKAARKEIEENYKEYYSRNSNVLSDKDYLSMTVEVNNIALLSNPIEYTSKKPVVWYQMVNLMEKADSRVRIHTPYIICNDYMYDGIKKVCDNVEDVSIMTNSVGNNGNPFGAADYYENKQNILNTGVNVLEYEGGYSYHGKSVLIDDNISIVGSFNMDMRSAYLDTELMLVIDSKEINEALGAAMDSYEKMARKANADGSYDNPNNVTPVESTKKIETQMNLIRKFIGWARFLF